MFKGFLVSCPSFPAVCFVCPAYIYVSNCVSFCLSASLSLYSAVLWTVCFYLSNSVSYKSYKSLFTTTNIKPGLRIRIRVLYNPGVFALSNPDPSFFSTHNRVRLEVNFDERTHFRKKKSEN